MSTVFSVVIYLQNGKPTILKTIASVIYSKTGSFLDTSPTCLLKNIRRSRRHNFKLCATSTPPHFRFRATQFHLQQKFRSRLDPGAISMKSQLGAQFMWKIDIALAAHAHAETSYGLPMNIIMEMNWKQDFMMLQQYLFYWFFVSSYLVVLFSCSCWLCPRDQRDEIFMDITAVSKCSSRHISYSKLTESPATTSLFTSTTDLTIRLIFFDPQKHQKIKIALPLQRPFWPVPWAPPSVPSSSPLSTPSPLQAHHR